MKARAAAAAASILGAAALALPTGAAAAVPTVSSLSPTAVGSQTATLRGRVNPHGLATTVFFQYGTTVAYGAQTGPVAVAARRSAVTVRIPIAGLQPTTRYHFRLVARNASGTVTTSDDTFRTARQGLAIVLSAAPNPVRFGGPTTISGAVTGTGAAGRTVQIEQSAFPFTAFVPLGNPLVADAQGHFAVPIVSFTVTTQFRARLTDRPVFSPVLTVGARAIVHTRVSRRHIRRGARVRFSGTVHPSEPGRPIAIQKRRHGRWITISGTVLRPGGTGFSVYGKTVRIRRGGLFRTFLGTGSGATVPSVGRTIRISTRR